MGSRFVRPPVASLVKLSVACLAAALAVCPAGAQQGLNAYQSDPTLDPTRQMNSTTRLEQKLDAQVPLDLPFRDETGQVVPLKTYFGQKPVILMMPFYKCTGQCTTELNGMVQCFRKLKFKPGDDFNVVMVSINPKEMPPLAAAKKQTYLGMYGHPETADGWHFLTGEQSSIQQLASAVGYHYTYDLKVERYSHPIGMMILTPEGKVSRYFYGAEYSPRDMRFALMDASAHKIGSLADEIQLYCFHYDPTTGKYGLLVNRIIMVAGIFTVLLLGSFILIMFRAERRQGTPPPATPPQMPANV
jgi:protein SCO1/2